MTLPGLKSGSRSRTAFWKAAVNFTDGSPATLRATRNTVETTGCCASGNSNCSRASPYLGAHEIGRHTDYREELPEGAP